MIGRSMGATAMPKTKPGDFERALQLVAALGGTKDIKAKLTELHEAEKSHDLVREFAEAAKAEATKRETLAKDAEAKAVVARQKLADDTGKANGELASRERAVGGRETAAGELEATQEAREADLARREALLAEAGVTGFAA